MSFDNILAVESIEKNFPGVKALDRVSFALQRGEVHALVGENGAGKSTLMHILGGIHQPDGGQIRLNGKKITFSNPLEAVKHGIGIVFQELSLIQELSVAENIFPTNKPCNRLGFVRFKELYRRTSEFLEKFGETIDPRVPVKHLTVAKQQIVEILKAMAKDPKILILDEPTSSLTQHETKILFKTISKLKEQGMSFIYISHHLNEIFEIADRVTVLRDGKYAGTVQVSETSEKQLVSMMVGREVLHAFVPRSKQPAPYPVLRVENLTHRKLFKNISFEINPGEIVGFAGLIGAGRSEIAKALFGIIHYESGSISINGQAVHIKSPKSAMRQGIAYTSENRKQEGLFLDMNIRQNCIAPQIGNYAKGSLKFMDDAKIDAFTDDCIRKMRIVTPSSRQRLRNLSGGNQQKVLLSMWLGIKPRVLIIDEPTKGVDVGAKSEIYDIIRALAETGVAIMVISSDLLEILAISDRIIVVKDGHISGTIDHFEATEENIIAKAAGVE